MSRHFGRSSALSGAAKASVRGGRNLPAVDVGRRVAERRFLTGRTLRAVRFFGIDSDLDRRRIQALRANPPGHAHSGARRRIFGAALEQWDALLEASAEVVPAASPILLFYALSQAGRAISAAHITGRQFQSRGHGLRVGDPAGRLEETIIKPEGGLNSSFAMFCRATGLRVMAPLGTSVMA
jgi:hypothetical protein